MSTQSVGVSKTSESERLFALQKLTVMEFVRSINAITVHAKGDNYHASNQANYRSAKRK
jgi:hypothetical protein